MKPPGWCGNLLYHIFIYHYAISENGNCIIINLIYGKNDFAEYKNNFIGHKNNLVEKSKWLEYQIARISKCFTLLITFKFPTKLFSDLYPAKLTAFFSKIVLSVKQLRFFK